MQGEPEPVRHKPARHKTNPICTTYFCWTSSFEKQPGHIYVQMKNDRSRIKDLFLIVETVKRGVVLILICLFGGTHPASCHISLGGGDSRNLFFLCSCFRECFLCSWMLVACTFIPLKQSTLETTSPIVKLFGTKLWSIEVRNIQNQSRHQLSVLNIYSSCISHLICWPWFRMDFTVFYDESIYVLYRTENEWEPCQANDHPEDKAYSIKFWILIRTSCTCWGYSNKLTLSAHLIFGRISKTI